MPTEEITNKKLIEKSDFEICKEAGLDEMLLTNNINKASSRKKIKATANIIARILAGSAGPYGSTAIIQSDSRSHLCTKDGLDIINKIQINDDVGTVILDMIRQIANTQVITVGDGSTSAILIANSLYQAITDNDEKITEITPKDIIEILDIFSNWMESKIKQSSRKISEDYHELETIAMISTNNDLEIGKNIMSAYQKIGEYGFISTDKSQAVEKDYVEIKQGIEWDRGYIDQAFTRDIKSNKIEHQDPLIFICNGTITYKIIENVLTSIIGNVCFTKNKPLLIICNAVDEEARNFFITNRNIKEINPQSPVNPIFTVVDLDNVTEGSKLKYETLALCCECEIYDPVKEAQFGINTLGNGSTEVIEKVYGKFIGHAKGAIINEKHTQVIFDKVGDEYQELIDKKISEVTDKIKEYEARELLSNDENMKVFRMKQQLADLKGSVAIYHVGGKTATERNTKERLIEDAIKACKSAIKSGYVIGGNLIVPYLLTLKQNYKEIYAILIKKFGYIKNSKTFDDILQLIKLAFLDSYRIVLSNSYLSDNQIDKIIDNCLKDKKFYNLKNHKYEDFDFTSVINPAETDIQILRSTISIIGILSTSNQVLTYNFNMENLKPMKR